MTHFVFPDNTVLCNFAAVNRLDLLEGALLGRGRWTQAVAYEAGRSSAHLPDLASVPTRGWLGDPIEVDDPREIAEIERVRTAVFGGPRREGTRHLGEAQTIYLILNRPELAGAWWVSDDRESCEYARRKDLTVRDTLGLVEIVVGNGDLTPQAGYDLMIDMRAKGRHPRVPKDPQYF